MTEEAGLLLDSGPFQIAPWCRLDDAGTEGPGDFCLPERYLGAAAAAVLAFLGVPVLRAGRTLGVLVVQNRTMRTYQDDEIEALDHSTRLRAILGDPAVNVLVAVRRYEHETYSHLDAEALTDKFRMAWSL